jgi:hypothetical protein
VADFTAGVDALGGEGAEDGRPVCGPCFVAFKVGFGDEFGDAEGELVDEGDSFGSSGDDGVVPAHGQEDVVGMARQVKTHRGFACFCCGLPRREVASRRCSGAAPILAAVAKSFAKDTADSKLSAATIGGSASTVVLSMSKTFWDWSL